MGEQVTGSRTSRGWVLCLLAHLHAMRGEFEAARTLYEEGRVAMEELGKRGLTSLMVDEAYKDKNYQWKY